MSGAKIASQKNGQSEEHFSPIAGRVNARPMSSKGMPGKFVKEAKYVFR
jgi:hypothetical protein